MALAVLFVCTGNVCRSPAAAALTASRSASGAGVTVSSAGLAALVDEPVDPPVGAALERIGVSAADHRARQYEPWMAMDADLVLAATSAHVAQILREVPQAMRRVFTIKEFVRLATAARIAREDPVAVVAAAAAMRGRVPPVRDGDDDVADPYRRGRDAAARTVAELDTVTRRLLDTLDAAARRRPQPYPR